MDKPTIVSTEELFKTDLFAVQDVAIRNSNGKTRTYTNINMRPASAIFPVTEKWEVYLLSEYRTLLGKETINAISGYIEPGETPIQAARRELMEEAGIEAEQLEEILIIDKHASVVKSQDHIFFAKGLTISKARPEEDELLSLIKIPLSEAVKKVLSGQITVASTIIGILTLEELRREKRLSL